MVVVSGGEPVLRTKLLVLVSALFAVASVAAPCPSIEGLAPLLQPASRNASISGTIWQRDYQDGRNSRATADLVTIAESAPDAMLIVLAGNTHTRTTRGEE
jgi:hypothetical protein